jgi:tRNA G46 methylase TrmB
MFGNSSPVQSNQAGPHHHLVRQLERHRHSPFLKPALDHNRIAFEASVAAWKAQGNLPLIIDAGCGVGSSTLHLSKTFPDHFVIGIDQSADRLSRHRPPDDHGNHVCVRADLVDYWRLMQAAGIRPARQYVLYPNPWPKAAHLGRRWHGHPVFPTIAELGGYFECRSNWHIYIQECAQTLHRLGAGSIEVERLEALVPITPFERKYLASGHSLWRCTAQLP